MLKIEVNGGRSKLEISDVTPMELTNELCMGIHHIYVRLPKGVRECFRLVLTEALTGEKENPIWELKAGDEEKAMTLTHVEVPGELKAALERLKKEKEKNETEKCGI